MTHTATKSFEIRTAREYLDELLRPAHADFMQDALSSRKAIACVIFAWHLHDWVWAQHKKMLKTKLDLKNKDPDYVNFLFKECPELKVLQELATGSKHFHSDYSDVDGTELTHGFVGSLYPPFTQSRLTVKTGETLHFTDCLLDKVVDFWNGFFAQHLTPPEQQV